MALRSTQLSQGILSAIKREELRIYIQPKCCTTSGVTFGYEVLLRWQHPKKGLLGPEAFLFSLNETELAAIDGWVVQQTLKHAATKNHGNRSMGINIEASSLCDARFMDYLATKLSSFPGDVGLIDIEITERGKIHSISDTALRLTKIKSFGVQVSLDDYGTGHNSLYNLSNLPVDTIKIERHFIKQAALRLDDRAILTQTATMMHNLGKLVVAEGVETKAELEAVREAGIEMAQGYLFGKPKPVDGRKCVVLGDPGQHTANRSIMDQEW